MTRVIFLGTAGSTAVVSKGLRASGGIIIQTNEMQLHLDPGPGALRQAKELGINLNHTSAILVSHNHLNHCNDLNIVVDAMTHSGLEHRGIILGSKSIFYPVDACFPILTTHHQSLVEKIIPLEKNHKVGIELIEIHALNANHKDPTALGFKIYCPKMTIGYSGDSAPTSELISGLTGSDFLILNVPYPGDKKISGSLNSENAAKIISLIKPKIAVLTHFGLDMLKADPINEAREVQRLTGIQTIAAKDGLAIAPTNYTERSPVKGFN
jgi:ribonuclease BN (tRNA processing enzyme)